jgi:archaellum component FlaC
MAFKALHLHFIRFLGPDKEPAEYVFHDGLNILWGSSDTGKTFLVQSIDYMLGAGGLLRDIPEKIGYDRILLGLTTPDGKDYTLQRSMDGGAFLRYDGLHKMAPSAQKDAKTLSAGHNAKNYTNLSNWLLQEVGLDKKEILYSKSRGTKKSLGFRALAHLSVIIYPHITTDQSPVLSGQWTERTRDYGVFRLLLTGVDDSSVTPETAIATKDKAVVVERPPLSPDVMGQMISDYEDELSQMSDNPDGLDDEETKIDDQLDKLASSLRTMEGRLSETTKERKNVYDEFIRLTARRDEISELQQRFKLLDAQYTNDIKRLIAIEESGQFFVLREPMACPLCGAAPEGQHHEAACDGNVTAVTQAAAAEIEKIKLLQQELHETVETLYKETIAIGDQRGTQQALLKGYQDQIDTALSPNFTEARRQHTALIERRAVVRQAVMIHKRIKGLRRQLDEPVVREPKVPVEDSESTEQIESYIPKGVLRDFSKTVEAILKEWHFPPPRDVYFDETNKDVVIGGKLRGNRGAGLCAITYSAFTLALFEYCRSRNMPHPGFVILDSPLIAYKEPKIEDENISGTDLKPRFYEHLSSFAGSQQIFVVDNTEPPPDFLGRAIHFTHNPAIPRYGLFPPLTKVEDEQV